MPVKPELLVRGLDGRPQPPADLLTRIKSKDPRLGLFYTNAAWAITETWRDDDPRWEWVQNQSVQREMAFDVCGYLPVTCSVDEAPAYIERELKNWTAEEFRSLRDTVRDWNLAGGHDAALENEILGAVSNDLDKSNIVSPGISTAVKVDLAPAKPANPSAVESLI